MELDRNGLEVLDRATCIERLASVAIARIGLSVQALPVILPVNFVIDGDEIIIRTTAGAKTESALRGSVVAVEADDFDPFEHTGWSVLVRGRSRLVDDPVEIERLSRLWVRAWATPHTDRWIAISTEIVTGRRIRHDVRAAGGGAERVVGSGEPAAALHVAVAWETWAMVRADHHTTAAEPRTAAAHPHVAWPSSGAATDREMWGTDDPDGRPRSTS